MDTTQRKIGSYRGFVMGTFVSLCLISAGATSAFAERKHDNPPDRVGGPGAGPAWRDNPNRVDNPPGPNGGRGTDWGNPPGPAGGDGRGPRWTDNPYRIDNPPGSLGGRGTDYGEGDRSHRQYPKALYRVATHRLERLKAKRERFAAKGAPADVLARLDEKIARKQAKIEEFLSKHQPPTGEEATSESGVEQE